MKREAGSASLSLRLNAAQSILLDLSTTMQNAFTHCPKCNALQPIGPECGVCGAPLATNDGSGPSISRDALLGIGCTVLGLLMGVVVAGIILILGFFWLL